MQISGGAKRKGKHGSQSLILTEQQILEVKIAKRQARIDSQLQSAQREQQALESLRQRAATNANNGLGARESTRLRDLEASYQQQMQMAAAEWRAAEEQKIEAEVERRTQLRIQEELIIQQHMQSLSVQASRVGEPNVIQNSTMDSSVLNDMSLDYVNRTRKQHRMNKSQNE